MAQCIGRWRITARASAEWLRLQIMLEGDELRALDDFRFANRMPSRAAAVRELLRRGLGVGGVVLDRGEGNSQSYGVLEPDPRADSKP